MNAVPVELLQALAAQPKAPCPRPSTGAPRFDIDEWISRAGLKLEGPTEWQGGRRWIFEVCPWNPDHRNRSAFIVQHSNGAIAARCHHNGCQGHDWHSLRAVVERESKFKSDGGSRPGADQAAAPWGPPLLFHQFDLPPFPTDVLADWLRDFVLAEARATQTPVDLSAMLALSVIAAACAKKVIVQLKEGYFEPLNIYTVTSLPPGNRKSAVFSVVVKPLEEFERAEAKRSAGEIARSQTAFKIKESTLKRLREQAAQPNCKNREALTQEAANLAAELEETHVGVPTRCIVDDCTPEKLPGILQDQEGRIAVFSPEGDVFELMAGRYSSNRSSNFAVYLKGHAGDTIRVDRVGRSPEFIKDPAITLGLAVQPDVIRGLAAKDGFRGRGLLGRFLYSMPMSLLGRRETNPIPVSGDILSSYRTNTLALLALAFGLDENGSPVPHILALSDEARECFMAFEFWIEPQLLEFGALGSLTDWAGKLAGAVGRIAGILHMAARAQEKSPWETPIAKETVEQAICIGKYLIPHAKAAYAEMGADAIVEQAKRILRWIEHEQRWAFSKRDLHQALRGAVDFKRVSGLDLPLALLVTHGYIRERQEEAGSGPGRKPSPAYDVNPEVIRPHDPGPGQ